MALIAVLLFSVQTAKAQEWLNYLPKYKSGQHQYTLKDYQKAFYTYWEKEHPKREKVVEKQGNEFKDDAYEHFKRWEWYWQSRVDPVTGAFPNTTAYDVYQQYLKAHPNVADQNSRPWINLGPFNSKSGNHGIGRVNSIAFSPADTNVIYVGSASGGIWKSTDDGVSWKPLGDFNSSLGVADMVVENEGGDDIIYLGTGDKESWAARSIGVLKSVDGGRTWNPTGLSWEQAEGKMVYRLLKDPFNDNTLYAATLTGLYKTTDGGENWTIINARAFRCLEFQPGSNTRMYASELVTGDIFYSENAGQTWTRALSNPEIARTELSVTPGNPKIVYAVMSHYKDLQGIYRSDDAGKTFSLIFNKKNLLGYAANGYSHDGQAGYDMCIAADPHNANRVFVGGINTWMSNDGGKSWTLSSHWDSSNNGRNAIVHADKHCLAFQPQTSTLFEGNDGGLYKTKNGREWDYISNGLAISEMYRLGTTAQVPGEVIAGLQDNGTKLLYNGKWKDVIGGDGTECIIDYTNDDIQYGTMSGGVLRRTNDHWRTWRTATSGLSGWGSWITPYLMHPRHHNTLYIGYEDVFKSTNEGDTWTKISAFGNKNALKSLAQCLSDSTVLYASDGRTLYLTLNGGADWTEMSAIAPFTTDAWITYISVKNDDPETLWVSLGGFKSPGVIESTDGGKTWKNISTGLPKLPVNCVIQNNFNHSPELFAATDVGVFVKRGKSDWQPFNKQFPRVVTDELEIHYDSIAGPTLYAATYGRGLWAVDISDETSLNAGFRADTLKGIPPFTVHFTDRTLGKPVTWHWDFGNGTTSNEQNPTVTYNALGNYTVSLIVSKDDGADTAIKTSYIHVKKLISRFSADTTSCNFPATVQFTDHSAGSPTAWDWDLNGDGAIDSHKQNPEWNYTRPGDYTVSLYTSNGQQKDTTVRAHYIHVHYLIPDSNFRRVINEKLGYAYPESVTHNPTKQELASITRLEALNKNITSLAGAENLVNCKWLDLSNTNNRKNLNKITDFTPLVKMVNLTHLSLVFTGCTDIGFLKKMPQLSYLDLSKNSITNINILSTLTNLTYLLLSNTDVSDISPLSKLTKLQNLYILSLEPPLTDIKPLSNLTNLIRLKAGHNNISNINALSGLTHLQYLSLLNNKIQDITPLRNLKKLQWLDLDMNQVRDAGPLSGLTSLVRLNIGANPLRDLSFLNKLNQIQILSVENLGLKKFPSSSNLSNLTKLDISGNNIATLKGIENYLKLQYLYANNNPSLYDLRGIETVPLQNTIVLQNCGISDFSPLMGHNRIMGKPQNLGIAWNPVSKEAIEKQIPLLGTTPPKMEPLAACYPEPINKTVSVPDTVTLRWQANFDDKQNVRYNLYLGTTPYNQPLVAQGLTATSYKPALQKHKNYWWRVETILDWDTIRSGVWYFNTDTAFKYQKIPLQKGWNIMSFNITPDTLNMLDILHLLRTKGEVAKVMDEQGHFVQNIPGSGWINTIGNMANTEGYYIKLAKNDTLKISGPPVNLPFTIPLQKGWNIMGYPSQKKQDARAAIKPLIDASCFVKVIGETGGFIQNIPGIGWVNTLGDFTPGQGYYIKVTKDTHLILNEATKKASVTNASFSGLPVLTSRYFSKAFCGNPYYPMDILVTGIHLEGIKPQPGDEIAVFDNGVCVGTGVLPEDENQPVLVVASMDDPSTPETDGYKPGDPISFRYMAPGLDNTMKVTPRVISGNLLFKPLATTVCDIAASPEGINNHSITSGYFLNIYPNPATRFVSFTINNPHTARLEIEIIDLTGKRQKMLTVSQKGLQCLRCNLSGIAPGIYIVRLTSPDHGKVLTKNHKFIIVK